jgi:hypothetical protein
LIIDIFRTDEVLEWNPEEIISLVYPVAMAMLDLHRSVVSSAAEL